MATTAKTEPHATASTSTVILIAVRIIFDPCSARNQPGLHRAGCNIAEAAFPAEFETGRDNARLVPLDALEAAEAGGAALNDSPIRDSLYDVLHLGWVRQQPLAV